MAIFLLNYLNWGRGWRKLESVWTVSIFSKETTAKLTTTFLSYVRQTAGMLMIMIPIRTATAGPWCHDWSYDIVRNYHGKSGKWTPSGRNKDVRYWSLDPVSRHAWKPFPARRVGLCWPCLHSSFNNLQMTQWSYQLTKQNWRVCELGTVLLFNMFWFENLPSGFKKVFGPLEKQAPRLLRESRFHKWPLKMEGLSGGLQELVLFRSSVARTKVARGIKMQKSKCVGQGLERKGNAFLPFSATPLPSPPLPPPTSRKRKRLLAG